MLEQFFSRLGLPKLRFKPAYNPYTEPSMEIFSYSEQLKKWMEVRGRGGRQVSKGLRGTMGTGCMFVQGSSSLFQRRHLGDLVHMCHEFVLPLCELLTETGVQKVCWPWLQWKGKTSFSQLRSLHTTLTCLVVRATPGWVQVGNSGMFRPEMLRPMGLPEDVNVIAWGLSLERPTMILYGIDNIRDLFGHRVCVGGAHRTCTCKAKFDWRLGR